VEGEKTVARSTDKLVEYGEKTWEAILKYMVSNGAGGTLERPKTPVLALLYQSGLMTDG
jgi:transcription initiation factor TFIIH subunit 4